MTAGIESPSKGLAPVTISQRVTASEKMSVRASSDWPLICSGDM